MERKIIPFHIELELPIKEILKILNTHGEGYIVGGYIRDKLLNLSPEDCDFVTNLGYSNLLEIFKNHSPKEIGKHFGILQIKYRGHFYEIAKYRIDLGVPSKRNEQIVIFTQDIFQDLKRRDFTVNSIAYNGESLIFLGSATSDLLDKKSLIFNGNPEKRILEDPLRLLRGIRFSITKNLFLENEDLYRSSIHLISNLSKERVRDEFIKILLCHQPSEGIQKLLSLGAMKYIIPEIIDLNSVCFNELDLSPPILETRLFLLLKNLPYKEILSRLKFSKKIVLKVQDLKTPFSKKNLNIDGNELQNLGFIGKEIGDTLNHILKFVLEGKLENNYEDIISFIKKEQKSLT